MRSSPAPPRGRAEADERPIVLTDRVGNREEVVVCCRRAAQLGVRAGMTAALARAVLGGRPRIMGPVRPAADRKGLDALAQWALQFSPLVQVDPHARAGAGGLLIDITGCQRLFGGERKLLHRAVAAVGRLRLEGRLALADTIGCAWGLARYGGQVVTLSPRGAAAEAIAPLPLDALRLPPRTLEALHTVGLCRVGQVLVLPRASLRDRFGPELPRRIDQALGWAWERVEPIAPARVPQVELLLGGPVRNADAIRVGAKNLLEKLLAKLAPGQLGVRLLELILHRSDAEPVRLRIPLSHASADAGRLWTLLRPELERANLGFGVESIRLRALETGELRWSQLPLLPDAGRDDRRIGELVDVLASRLGRTRVSVVDRVDSHLPERSFLRTEARERLRRRTRKGRRRPKKPGRRPPPPRADRPSRLLDPPEPVEVLAVSPEGPVARLRWRGQTLEVVRCVGPERISAAWWTGRREDRARLRDAERDYYKLQNAEGRWLWLYRRRGDNGWFVHGLWS